MVRTWQSGLVKVGPGRCVSALRATGSSEFSSATILQRENRVARLKPSSVRKRQQVKHSRRSWRRLSREHSIGRRRRLVNFSTSGLSSRKRTNVNGLELSTKIDPRSRNDYGLD